MARRRWLVEQDNSNPIHKRRLFYIHFPRKNWIISEERQHELVDDIIKMWAYAIDFNPVRVNSTSDHYQINIHWSSRIESKFRAATRRPDVDSPLSAGPWGMALNTHDSIRWDELLYKKTISHEFGHALGLDHYGTEGQYDPLVMDGDLGKNRLYIPQPPDLNQAGKRYGFRPGMDVTTRIPDFTIEGEPPPVDGPDEPVTTSPIVTPPATDSMLVTIQILGGTYSGTVNREGLK